MEIACIAQHADKPDTLRVLALYCDGRTHRDMPYAIAGTPCETVLGQEFRVYPSGVQALFPRR